MDYRSLPGGHQPPHSNASMQGGTWSSESFPHAYAVNPHQYASTQQSPQFPNDCSSPRPDYYQTSFNTESTQGPLSPFNPYYIYEQSTHPAYPVHPIHPTHPPHPTHHPRHTHHPHHPHHSHHTHHSHPAHHPRPAHHPYPTHHSHHAHHPHPVHPADTVAFGLYGDRAYDSSHGKPHHNNALSPPLFREEIPQYRYECGNSQKRDEKPPIHFSKGGVPGVRLVDALGRRFEGIDDRDDSPFGEDCSGITIRTHFCGYPSSTEVDRILKLNGKPRARSMQVSTKDYRAKRRPVTKERLVREVSKRIKWYTEDLLKYPDLFRFNNSVEERWRLGQGMKLEHMVITSIENVSNGSWSATLCIDRR